MDPTYVLNIAVEWIKAEPQMGIIKFASLTGFFSSIILILDFFIVSANGQSFFGVTHGVRTLWYVFVWFFGGGLVAIIGSYLNIYQQTAISSITIGITWRSFIEFASKLSNTGNSGKDQQINNTAGEE